MNRRKFIAGAAAGLGAAYLGPNGMATALDAPVRDASLPMTARPKALTFRCSDLDRSCNPNFWPRRSAIAAAARMRSEIIRRSCSASEA